MGKTKFKPEALRMVGESIDIMEDIYCCPEHECETCGGSGEVADLKKAVWGDCEARDHK